VEVGHVDALSLDEVRDEAERLRCERDVERQQGHVEAMHRNAVDLVGARSGGDDDDLVTGLLEVLGQVVHLHLDATDLRQIAVCDQADPHERHRTGQPYPPVAS
jgi:hypothetical protein